MPAAIVFTGANRFFRAKFFAQSAELHRLGIPGRKYKYDPLKRVPERVKISDNYKPEDFSL